MLHWFDMVVAAFISVLIWVLVSLVGLGKIASFEKLLSLLFGG